MSDDKLVLVVFDPDDLHLWYDGDGEVLSRRAEQTGSVIDPSAEGFPPDELRIAVANALQPDAEGDVELLWLDNADDAICAFMEWAVGRNAANDAAREDAGDG